jgi:hypothetical protein
MSSGVRRDDEIYRQGVHDGQQADFVGQVAHSFSKNFTLSAHENEIYKSGFDYGVAHRPEPQESSLAESAGASAGPGSTGAASGSTLDAGDGNPVVSLFAFGGAIWGAVEGYKAGGFWGAFFGAIFGMFAGYLAALAAMIAIGLVILYWIGWGLWHVVKFIWS